MAYDRYRVSVGFVVRMPDYECTDVETCNERRYGNKELKVAVKQAVLEQLAAVMPMVVVDGEEYPIECITDAFDPMDHSTEVVLDADEKAAIKEEEDANEAGWDAFQAELDRRSDDIKLAAYSMGDLYGPIEQLDEVRHEGMAMVAIRGGWGDKEPVFSDSAMMNPTNWDMFRMFDQALAKSQDHHHVFLENLHYVETDVDGVAIYEAITGS